MSEISVTKPRTPRTNKVKVVALAKDVIKHIDSIGNIVPGTYVSIEVNPSDSLLFVEGDRDKDVQEVIEPITKKCQACALGACFLSYVRLYDNVKFGEFYLRSSVPPWIRNVDIKYESLKNVLMTVFSNKQLCLIENAFERRDMVKERGEKLTGISESENKNAIMFGKRFTSSRNRLLNIMQNIVSNNGMFIP